MTNGGNAMKIITLSREFGSGGREVGKRLADVLNIAYYDKEIIMALAEETKLDEKYVEHTIENSAATHNYPLTFSRTLTLPYNMTNTAELLGKQHKIIRRIASQGDCIIVGRSADAILDDMNPFKLFIYADLKAKIARCRDRASENEQMTDREYEKQMKRIDKARAYNHDFVADRDWGDMRNYNLCVNTTGVEIKKIIPQIADFINNWYSRQA